MPAYCLLLFALSISSEAFSKKWTLEAENDHVKIYSRSWPNDDFREVKGVTTVTASMRQLVSFLQDETINTQWVPYSGGATILERPDQHQSYVHFRIDAQWPFKNRDTVALFRLSQNTGNKHVTISLESASNKIPELPDHVRIRHYQGSWKLVPLNTSQIQITYQSHLNPEGNIPAWIANRVAYKSMLTSLSNLASQISDYQHVSDLFLFIKE